MNIWSGSNDWLCAALTNPTHISLRKGKIKHDYPLADKNGKTWRNAEIVYKHLKTGDLDKDIAVMTRIIRAKLAQYPELKKGIAERGGVAWLKQCSHHTGARFSRWEGDGEDSAFIRALIAAYQPEE